MMPVDVIEFVSDSRTALIVLHEIYGVNRHISGVCERYRAVGYDVYCPDLLGTAGPFPYEREEEAYGFFMDRVGFGAYSTVNDVARGIRHRYDRVFLMGFSVGATLAWICANSGRYDGAVCCYGSRIRDHLHAAPRCPALVLFARREKAFDPENVVGKLSVMPGVRCEIFDAGHGFCDPFSRSFDRLAAECADAAACGFLAGLR